MPNISKTVACILSLIPLFFLLLYGTAWIGTKLELPWFPSLAVHFHLEIDNLSFLFLLLTAIIIPISILAVPEEKVTSPSLFYGLILFLELLLIGFFTARDLVLFTIFWEAMLLPLYFIITIWGGAQKKATGLKFMVYMIAGSTLMVAAVLALYIANGSFDMNALSKTASQSLYAPWILLIFLFAFAVKTPLFPFHGWLPDSYCFAPTAGTILLAALLSKAGVYGILRIGFGFFPTLMHTWSPYLLGLAIAGVLYGGLTAWMQKDFKRLIAYSSLSHVNFILAGLFIWFTPAREGAILQAFNHGITIAGLFLVAGFLEERIKTTSLEHVGGLAQFLPHLCWLTLVFALSAVSLPGTNNFVGEFLVLLGAFKENRWMAAILALTVIISVLYMLRFMQKLYFGKPTFFQNTWVDMRCKEFWIALPLLFLIFWVGIYPAPLLNLIKGISS